MPRRCRQISQPLVQHGADVRLHTPPLPAPIGKTRPRRYGRRLEISGNSWKFPGKSPLEKDGDRRLSVAIDRKLCLTAVAVGAVGRKDLAAAFRRANGATSFDLTRAHKWLQGRARPRDAALYEDWARVLGLDRPGSWIAACPLDEFVDALCARLDLSRDLLLERAAAFGGAALKRPPEVDGRYACYSHAWSPYFHGRLIRGELSFGPAEDGRRLVAAYSEQLPTQAIRFDGAVSRTERAIYLDLCASGGPHLLFCLFPATTPWSILGGMMCGATVIGPDAQPSVTRIVMIRLPEGVPATLGQDPYLAEGATVVGDLERLGMRLPESQRVEAALRGFLDGGPAGGLDQIGTETYKQLVGLFDRQWLALGRDEASAA